MATQNVKFYFGTQAKYDALSEKNSMALYFIEDTNRLYKGSVLIASGATATSMASGLMSTEDKIKLDELAAGDGLANLVPVDDSIIITDKVGGGKSIGVAISTQAGNALVIAEDGLFVAHQEEISIPEYTIEKLDKVEDGLIASYQLKKTVDGISTYVGDAINIAKDMVLQGATLETVVEADVPYAGAVVGDPYIDMVFNDAKQSHIYIPVKRLVDTYTAGKCIDIVDGKISVKIADNAHGLTAVNGTMTMLLASANQDGAMPKEDKVFIDSIPTTYATIDRVKATTEHIKYNISATPKGALVHYGEQEIRIMCPEDTVWTKQQVGAGGNPNMYYMTFTTYAPDNAVAFKEGDKGVIIDEVLNFETTAGTGVDKYGRKYKNHWFALAMYDQNSGTWTYFGKNSTAEKYIGWDYIVEWFDADGVKIGCDQIRINLSNEKCNNTSIPYYISKYATNERVSAIEDTIDLIDESFVWGEM